MTLLRGGSASQVCIQMLLVLVGAVAGCGVDAQGLGANVTTSNSSPDGGVQQGMGVLLDGAPGARRDGADRGVSPTAADATAPHADASVAEEDTAPDEVRSVDGGSTQNALLVIGGDVPDPGDDLLARRLEKLGFAVTVFAVRDNRGPPHVREIAPMHDVVVFSTTYNATTFRGTMYDDLPVGILNMEHSLYPDLQMTRPNANTEVGTVDDQTKIEVVLSNHPLAAGLPDGDSTVVSSPSRFDWGRPLDNAIKIAIGAKDGSLGLIFAYEKGMALANLKAPARRVGFFPNALAVPLLNSKGWALFDAAVRWAATP